LTLLGIGMVTVRSVTRVIAMVSLIGIRLTHEYLSITQFGLGRQHWPLAIFLFLSMCDDKQFIFTFTEIAVARLCVTIDVVYDHLCCYIWSLVMF